MESFFPQLFFLSFVAPVVLRLALAGIFFYDAQKIWKTLPSRRMFAAASVILGVLIAIGLFTQIAAIAAGIQAVLAFMRYKNSSVFGNAATLVLAFAILVFLFLTGPGGLAFDLPY